MENSIKANTIKKTFSRETSVSAEINADAAIEIRWPSGIVQNLTHVRVDQEVHVDEPGS